MNTNAYLLENVLIDIDNFYIEIELFSVYSDENEDS